MIFRIKNDEPTYNFLNKKCERFLGFLKAEFLSMNAPSLAKRVQRHPFEFERSGQPLNRPNNPHLPDFSLTVNKFVKDAPNPRNQKKQKKILGLKKKVLDTLFLVDLFGTSKLENFEEINSESKRLTEIDLEAFKLLKNIKRANFGDNYLPLEPFAVLPNLEELDLSCNALKKFDFNLSNSLTEDRAWSCLHTLDLSYNYCGNFIADLSLIPLLTSLNLSNNSLSMLPSNLMYFTCLTDLDLSNNNLNSDLSFFSLATIPSLQNLILDNNGIIHIPKFQFGFESLLKISIKNNSIEMVEDMDSLADLNLQEVNIVGNPIVLRPNYLAEIRRIMANSRITLICDVPPPPQLSCLTGKVKSVPIDPLTLPFKNKRHMRALKKNTVRGSQKLKPMDEKDEKHVSSKVDDDDVFMTAFTSKSIEPTQLPIPSYEDENEITNVWCEIPVLQREYRKSLSMRIMPKYMKAFKDLQFLVANPECKSFHNKAPKKKDNEIDLNVDDEDNDEMLEEILEFVVKEPTSSRRSIRTPRNMSIRSTSSRKREETVKIRNEINEMFDNMDEQIMAAEIEMQIADDNNEKARKEALLDEEKFATLHKQHEAIRASLMNTLNQK